MVIPNRVRPAGGGRTGGWSFASIDERFTARAVTILSCAAILLGVYARLSGLGDRLFFADESYSAFRVSGHTRSDLFQLFDGRIRPGADLAGLQRIDPARGVAATVHSIATEEPQRGPLFYITGRLWAGIAGDSAFALRLLSVALGLVGIALAYVTVRELSGSAMAGALGAGLYALSPIQVHYAQQFREYSSLATASLLSVWLLSLALRRNRIADWAMYALAVAIGLYIDIEFALVLVAQAVAVAALTVRSDRRTGGAFTLASVAGCVAYLPWLALVAPQMSQGSAQVQWVNVPYSVRSLALRWAFNLGASFFDAEYARRLLGVVLLPVIGTLGYAAVRMSSRTVESRTRWIVWTLAASAAVPLIALDAIRGAHYEGITRYLMSSWVGVTLIAALGLAVDVRSSILWRRCVALASITVLVACGAYCALDDGRHPMWWDNNDHFSVAAVAKAAGAQAQPLVVASALDERASYLLTLGRYLPNDASVMLFRSQIDALPPRRALFVFLPAAEDRARLGVTEVHWTNVSPQPEFAVPDLRAAGTANPDMDGANALWLVSRRGG